MQTKGQVVIHLEGQVGNSVLTPDNYDITLMKSVLDVAMALLDIDKRKDRPITTCQIGNGSVKNIFTTSRQKAVEVASVLTLVSGTSSIDVLDARTAHAFETLQQFAVLQNLSVAVYSSEKPKNVVRITPQTYFHRTESRWVDAEVYFYGTLVDAGGKNKSNIHLDTSSGLLTIDVDKDVLKGISTNPLYRKYGVRVSAKQNIITGEYDLSSLKLIEFLDFEPKVDMAYLNRKIENATPVWSGIDVEKYLSEIRGYV